MADEFLYVHHPPALPFVAKANAGNICLPDRHCAKIRVETAVNAAVTRNENNIGWCENQAKLLFYFPQDAFDGRLVALPATAGQVPH